MHSFLLVPNLNLEMGCLATGPEVSILLSIVSACSGISLFWMDKLLDVPESINASEVQLTLGMAGVLRRRRTCRCGWQDSIGAGAQVVSRGDLVNETALRVMSSRDPSTGAEWGGFPAP